MQRGVRLPEKSSKLGCARCFSPHANANGELYGGVLLNKYTRFTRLAKTLCDRDGLLEVSARQKDHKLVTGLSPEYCGAASDRLFEHLGEVSESAVSSLVPISLIEATKGIDIAGQRGDRLSRSPCFLKGFGCDGVEPWSVQQSGQRVDHRQANEFLMRYL
jgi:hypothetical protein